jgi:hypothetical protein
VNRHGIRTPIDPSNPLLNLDSEGSKLGSDALLMMKEHHDSNFQIQINSMAHSAILRLRFRFAYFQAVHSDVDWRIISIGSTPNVPSNG